MHGGCALLPHRPSRRVEPVMISGMLDASWLPFVRHSAARHSSAPTRPSSGAVRLTTYQDRCLQTQPLAGALRIARRLAS